MQPIPFAQQNGVVSGSKLAGAQTTDEIPRIDIPVQFDQVAGTMLSIWQPTDADREILAQAGGAVVLVMKTPGGQHPPVFISSALLDIENPEPAEDDDPVLEQKEEEVLYASAITDNGVVRVPIVGNDNC